MADFDANVNLSLDTSHAKAQLRKLNRGAKQHRKNLATRLGKWTQRTRKLAPFLGPALFANRFARLTSGQDVNPWGQALTPFMAAIQETIDSAVGFSARGLARGRAEVRTQFAIGGDTTATAEAAGRVFKLRQPYFQLEEEGRNIVRKDPQFRGPSLTDLIAQALPGYVNLIRLSFQYVIDGICGRHDGG